MIGPYRILGEIGRGGFGAVTLGEHVESGTRVAIKRIHVPAPEQLAGIRREIRVLARACRGGHPGIVRIVDDGIEAGLPWYAMELVQGSSLRHHAEDLIGQSGVFVGSDGDERTEVLPDRAARTRPRVGLGGMAAGGKLREILALVRRLCAPLAYLHGEGIVHRDLKPDNVIVRPDGEPVIVDFGLTLRHTREGGREALEVAGPISGTASYMSPEQCRGEDVDARADIYALGCLLYELITGAPPFIAPSPVQVLVRHMSDPPTPPSVIVGGVSSDLDALVLRLLEKDPRRRWGYAEDVARALERLVPFDGDPPGDASTARIGRPYLYRSRLAGRDALLDRIIAPWQDARGGRGAMVFLAGESGIGKTRLLREAASRIVSQDGLALVGEPESAGEGAAPLQHLRGPLRTLSDSFRGVTESATVFGPRMRILSLYERSLASLHGHDRYPAAEDLPPEVAVPRLLDALSETLKAAALAIPILLVLDDLQWADPLTLAFLSHLARGPLQEMRLYVLGSFRSGESPTDLSELIATVLPTRARCHTIAVERIAEDAVRSIVGDMLGCATPGQSVLVSSLERHSEGNPLFVAEYLRSAVEEGVLRRDEQGSWIVPADEASFGSWNDHLPRSLEGLLSKRLGRLSESARRVLGSACVLGREVDPEILLAMIHCDLDEGLEELRAAAILEEQGAGMLRFAHDKLREVAYGQLSRPARVDRHAAAARALEGRSESNEAALARHWHLAGDPGRAAPWAFAAARRALSVHALADAETHFRHGISLSPEPTADRMDASFALACEVLRPSGRSQDALSVARLALADARHLGDAQGEGRALTTIAFDLWTSGEMAAAFDAATSAIASLRGKGSPASVLRAVGLRAAIATSQGRMREAALLHEEARGLLDATDDPRAKGEVLGHIATHQQMQGCVEESVQTRLLALQYARASRSFTLEAALLSNLAVVEQDRGDLDAAQSYLDQSLVLCRRIGDRRMEANALVNLGLLVCQRRAYTVARKHFSEALAIQHETGARPAEAMCLLNLAMIDREEGNLDGAERLLDETLTLQRSVDDARGEALTLVHLGAIAEARGDLAKAQDLMELSLGMHRAAGEVRFEAVCLYSLAAIHRIRGRTDVSAELLDRAEEILRRLGDRFLLAEVFLQKGYLGLTTGQSASPFLEGLEAIGIDSMSPERLAAFRRAIVAAGHGHSLIAGQCAEDLDKGHAAWLARRDVASPL